jgi:hypothetical protein
MRQRAAGEPPVPSRGRAVTLFLTASLIAALLLHEDAACAQSVLLRVAPAADDGAAVPACGPGAVSFNAVTTTTGRASLARALASAASQLRACDFLTLICDAPARADAVAALFASLPCACTKVLHNTTGMGAWGHAALNLYLPRLAGDFLTLFDDDDAYLPGAFAAVRAAVRTAEPRLYIFRLVREWDRRVEVIPPWEHREAGQLRLKFIAKVNGVFPAGEGIPHFGLTYLGDAAFYFTMMKRLGDARVTVLPTVTYQQGQARDLAPLLTKLRAEHVAKFGEG